jgi:phosphatidylinositol glycan class B
LAAIFGAEHALGGNPKNNEVTLQLTRHSADSVAKLTVFPAVRQFIWPDRSGSSGAERLHLRYCLAVSAFLFFVCAVFSIGQHNPDEYYQIVEFASTKLGISDPVGLPWEYREEIRSWLQPAMYVGVARVAGYFGLQRPLSLLFLFRLTTAIILWSALWSLVVAGRHWFSDEIERRRLYSVAAFLWLLPFLGSRTSSEALSAAALCFGIALLEWRTRSPSRHSRSGLAVLAGAAFGLCFDFRYTSGFMAAGAGVWYLLPAKERLSLFVALAFGALLALAFGAVADWWGYGHITFPAYSYFYQNFVLGRSRTFGSDPFFAYLYIPPLESYATAPLSFGLLVATLVAWLARPFSVLTWASVPYVVLLCVAAHKEARFVFPLIPFLPFFVGFALSSRPRYGTRLAVFFRWLASGFRLKLGYLFNFVGLLGVIALPQSANYPLYQLIENESFAVSGPFEVIVIHAPARMPYGIGAAHMVFLEPKNLRWISNPSLPDLEARRARGETFLALVNIPIRVAEAGNWVERQCALQWSTYPHWLEPYNYLNWQARSPWWMLYRCGGD